MQKNQNGIISTIDSQQAIAAIVEATKDTPVILDFDETLLLRNSTAEYIDSFRPHTVGFLLIILLRIIKPWSWLPGSLGGDKTRDWYLVTIPTILLPWTLLRWRKKAQQLAEAQSNSEIAAAVEANSDAPVIVASLGFKFIIQPILEQMPVRYDRLVSCRFWRGAGDRNKGKLLMMQEVLTESEIKSAILVTDSQDDLPLLRVVQQPCFVLWSQAKYIEPFKDLWLYASLKRLKK